MSLSSGVYSLIGVAVGGGLTLTSQWGLAARADRLDARVAKRRVRAELREHQQITGLVLSLRPGAVDESRLLIECVDQLGQVGSRAWTEHADRLARQLSDAEWDAVEHAYDSIASLAQIPFLGWEVVAHTHTRIEDALKRLG